MYRSSASPSRRPADRAATDSDKAFKQDSVRKTDVEVEQFGQGKRSAQKPRRYSGPERRTAYGAAYGGTERRAH